MSVLSDTNRAALADLVLSTADDKLMLGHRNSDWTGLGPILEEDIAFSAFAQDDMAHAQALYEYASTLLDRSADQLAFGRDVEAYRCSELLIVDDTFDWATAITRLYLFSEFNLLRYNRLAASSDDDLRQLASRLAAEQQIVLEHVTDWVDRLGRGTDESRTRMQAALDEIGPLASTLFEPVDGQDALAESGLYPGSDAEMFASWSQRVSVTLDRAGLRCSLGAYDDGTPGGRRGVHSDQLSVVLDEMCEVFRTDPDASW